MVPIIGTERLNNSNRLNLLIGIIVLILGIEQNL